MVSIIREERNWCSGTLISENHILTAAHCLEIENAKDNLFVVLGSDNILDLDGYYRIEREIENYFIHPNYEEDKHYYDVAIIKMDIGVPYDKNQVITPICLPKEPSENVNKRSGQLVTLTGYGATESGGENQLLRFTTLQIYSQNWCNRTYTGRIINSLPDLFTSNVMCAGYTVSISYSIKKD